ncbi:hypothetical protein INT47_000085 [Mucor saturninus]|uniref:Transmembrane protein 242 n=1 Tax=Mucor saturninus TaxID=64648 RepID=A0A8H7RJT4_9FUNG|nr:hypothetical protein INT47_000085 [Mucor saturninus]
MSTMSPSPPAKDAPLQPPTTALMAGAAGAFGAGLLGAIWYTQRKQNKRIATEILEGTVPTNKYTPPKYIPPVMTPAEKIIAKKEASLFAFKTLAYGTLLAWGTAGLLAVSVGWYLDVRNFQEFSDKLKVIVPKKTANLRKMLGGTKLEMTEAEQLEIDTIQLED